MTTTPAVFAESATDALLDAVGDLAPHEVTGLTARLVAWRREVHAAPARELCDVDTALATIRSGCRTRSWGARLAKRFSRNQA